MYTLNNINKQETRIISQLIQAISLKIEIEYKDLQGIIRTMFLYELFFLMKNSVERSIGQ